MKHFTVVFTIGLFAIGIFPTTIPAQDDRYVLAHDDVFGNLRRPAVIFPHNIHIESLDDDGCGVCHHVRDSSTKKLTYEEGEEYTCKECHGRKVEEGRLALREAYHSNCTECHRDKNNKQQRKAGPTTCGQCHKRTKPL
ncbi:cytochrome c3 family protein [Thermodesulfobacteriota bacterium]